MTRRKAGLVLLLLSYVVLLYTTLGAPSYARAHPHLDPLLVGQYARPWPLALACALVLAGVMLAVVPIRRGEAWAMWTTLGMLAILLATRMTSDPRCLVVLDPHQHGCHTFLIAMVLGVIGLLLARK